MRSEDADDDGPGVADWDAPRLEEGTGVKDPEEEATEPERDWAGGRSEKWEPKGVEEGVRELGRFLGREGRAGQGSMTRQRCFS